MERKNENRDGRLGAAGVWAVVVFVWWAAGVCVAALRFSDVTGQTGITFVHTDGGCGTRYAVETMTAGLALFDYDNDGDVDVYLLNGAPLKGCKFETVPRNGLYRNEGGMRFTDVTEESGLGDTGYGLAVVVGDYDNDGDADVYLNNFGPNVLYRNNGDGTFTDVTAEAGVANGEKFGAGVCFLDADGDGDLDLYVSNYIEWSYETHRTNTVRGYPVYMGPPNFPGLTDVLYRNNGDGTFTDVSEAAGIAMVGTGMGMICADYDNDGDTDIFVANDMAGNFLFVNDGKGHFEDFGLLSGFAYDINGEEHGSMGVGCGDYDNDGRLDFYVTSYQGQFTTLYRNAGDGLLEDVTMDTGAGDGTLPAVTWGNDFVDFDNDGDRDIFVACGHLQTNVEQWDDTTTYRTPNIVFENLGNGRFKNVSAQAGDGLAVRQSSRGAAFDDLDGDGDVDVVVLNSRGPATVLRNDSEPQGHWLQVRLRGTRTNRDGVGAHVRVYAGDRVWLDEVHRGAGYQSCYGQRLYFGLGDVDAIDRVEVHWVGGATEVYRGIQPDRQVVLVEGSGEHGDSR